MNDRRISRHDRRMTAANRRRQADVERRKVLPRRMHDEFREALNLAAISSGCIYGDFVKGARFAIHWMQEQAKKEVGRFTRIGDSTTEIKS